MSKRRTVRRWTRLLIGIPAGAILIAAIVFGVIPPLVMPDMANRHVTFSRTWTGADHDLDPDRLVLTTQDGLDVVRSLDRGRRYMC